MSKRYNITKRDQVEAAAIGRDLCTLLVFHYAKRMKFCYRILRVAKRAKAAPDRIAYLTVDCKNAMGNAGRYRNRHRQCVQRIVRYVAAHPLT